MAQAYKNSLTEMTGPDASEVGRKMGLNDALKVNFFLLAIQKRIDGVLDYKSQLIQKGRTGTVTVDFTVDPSGQLKGAIQQNSGDDEALRELVLQTIIAALKEPLPKSQQGAEPITISAVFHFEIYGDKEAIPQEDPPVFKNTISFYRNYIGSKIFLATQSFNDPRDKGVSADFVALYYLIFGKRKVDSAGRMIWDMEYARKESKFACDEQNYEGACEKVAKIEAVLGFRKESQRHYKKACELGSSQSCANVNRTQRD